jgi:hypothetical protein
MACTPTKACVEAAVEQGVLRGAFLFGRCGAVQHHAAQRHRPSQQRPGYCGGQHAILRFQTAPHTICSIAHFIKRLLQYSLRHDSKGGLLSADLLLLLGFLSQTLLF